MPFLFHNYICSSTVKKKKKNTNNSFQICPFSIKAPNLFFMLNISKFSKIGAYHCVHNTDEETEEQKC